MIPKIVVLIPTRNRADTLASCLKTFERCSYQNLSVIVANNSSDDNTIDVVEAFSDSRFEVISTPKRVGMSLNFEFALQHVLAHYDDDTFVVIIGDDDGVLNYGFEKIAEMLERFPRNEAFTWKYPGYSWPSVVDKVAPNILDVALSLGDATVKSSSQVFQKFVAGEVRYTELVRVYHGLVKVSLVRRLLRKGRLIYSMAPDIYLGVVATLSVKEIVEVPFPLTINGASGHSTGSLAVIGGKPRTKKSQAALFYEECNLDPHPSVGMIPPTLRICEFESLQFARDLGFWADQVNPEFEFQNGLNEIARAQNGQSAKIEASLANIALFFDWQGIFAEVRKNFDYESVYEKCRPRSEFDFSWNRKSRRFRVACEKLRIVDIDGAVRIADFLYRFREFVEGDESNVSGVWAFSNPSEIGKAAPVSTKRIAKGKGAASSRFRRLKNWIFQGGEKSNGEGKRDREQRKKERLNERRRAKGVLNFKADLEAPDVDFLAERERERARLEASGWIFAQPKRLKLINDRRITTILDCGANSGQYVDDLKKARWAGKVYSFEPLSEAYAILSGKAVASDQWQAFHCALGEENGESTIQVAGNSYSSSLLEFSTDFKELRPDASPVGSETVTIRRLDDVVKEEGFSFDGPVMLKLDVQGFELSVLRGALETLPRVSVIQCELALIPSYEGGATFVEVREFLRDQGFVLAHLIDGHANHETGELREVDGIFLNVRLAPVES
jgi:FkbM family methyltransferase